MTARRVLYHHRIRADDGQAVHVRELIAALRRCGHNVDECALVPKAAAGERREAAGSLWRRLRLPRAAQEVLEVLYNRTGRSLLRRRAALAAPDFVYERHALHCRAGLDIAREFGVPLLLEVNSPMVEEMAALGQLRLAARARRTEALVLAGADAVLAVTRVLADRLVAAGARPERVHVIGNGAQPERYTGPAVAAAPAVRARFGLGSDAFVLGFIGYLRPWHRLELVLDAMQQPRLRTLALVAIGRGPALEPLLAEARRRGLGGRVVAPGEVPPDLLPAHVLACDATLIPAINAYASPLKLFDSLAAGVPVVAPDQPNLRETIADGEDGLLFAPGDAGDLADKLAQLVADRGFAARLGAAGRRRLLAADWTWDGNARRVAGIYEALAAGGVP